MGMFPWFASPWPCQMAREIPARILLFFAAMARGVQPGSSERSWIILDLIIHVGPLVGGIQYWWDMI